MPHPPDVRRQRARQQRQHRGLAGAVDADDADPVARPEPPGRVRQQLARPAGQVDVLDVDHVLAQPLGGEPLQLQPVARRWHVLDQRGGGVDPELRLGGPRRRPAAQPGQLLAHQVLPAYLRGRRLPLALGLGQHERGVPALVGVDHPVVHLPRPLAHGVQEPPVVGHHHQCRGAVGEVVGEPGDGLDVQVVRRLVEYDEVVVAEQQRGQRTAAPLPAGEPEHRPVQLHPGEQLVDDLAQLRVGGPLVVGPAAEHRLPDAVAVDQLVALVEVADQQPAGLRHPAAVRRLEAGHHLEQRGLPVAVAADDPDPLPRADAEGDVGEQRAHAVRLGDPLQVEKVRHYTYSTTCAPATGPVAIRTPTRPDRPAARRRRGRRPRSRTRPRNVGPDPESSTASAPASVSRSRVAARSGRCRSAGSCRSLRSARDDPEVVEVRPLRSRPSGADAGGGVELGVHLRRREAGVVGHHDPPQRRVVGQRGDHLAATGAPSGSAHQRERHVAAELGGQGQQVVVGGVQRPQPVERDQGGGRVGAAAGHPAGHRDALGDVQVRRPGRCRGGRRAAGRRGARCCGRREVRRRGRRRRTSASTDHASASVTVTSS